MNARTYHKQEQRDAAAVNAAYTRLDIQLGKAVSFLLPCLERVVEDCPDPLDKPLHVRARTRLIAHDLEAMNRYRRNQAELVITLTKRDARSDEKVHHFQDEMNNLFEVLKKAAPRTEWELQQSEDKESATIIVTSTQPLVDLLGVLNHVLKSKRRFLKEGIYPIHLEHELIHEQMNAAGLGKLVAEYLKRANGGDSSGHSRG